MRKKLISIIIPVYNEEDNIELLYEKLKKVFLSLKEKYNFEIIFIDDGSNDGSYKVIKKIAEKDERVKCVGLSRNFGKEIAISAGIFYSSGDAAVIMDGDLQHPPELISEFLKKWKEGFDIVIGIKKNVGKTNFIRRISSLIFYKIMQIISETEIVSGETDFRLIDRKIIKEFNRFTERNRIARGLIDWLGFKKAYVIFRVNERKHGLGEYSYGKLVSLALVSFTTHSLFPLRLVGYLGVVVTIFSGLLGLFIFLNKYIINDPFGFHFSGTAILAIFNLFLTGIMLFSIGIVSLYIANIHSEVSDRPLFIVKRRINFDRK